MIVFRFIYFFEMFLSLEDLCNSDKSPEVYSQHTWDFSLYRNNDQKESSHDVLSVYTDLG